MGELFGLLVLGDGCWVLLNSCYKVLESDDNVMALCVPVLLFSVKALLPDG